MGRCGANGQAGHIHSKFWGDEDQVACLDKRESNALPPHIRGRIFVFERGLVLVGWNSAVLAAFCLDLQGPEAWIAICAQWNFHYPGGLGLGWNPKAGQKPIGREGAQNHLEAHLGAL